MSAIPTLDEIAALGIVGAGGAGFPLAKKLETKADTYLVNAAECEPLLHKDKEMARAFAAEMLEGLRIGMALVGAREGVIGVKAKYEDLIEMLRARIPSNVRLHLMGNYYPAGDEFILVYEATGRTIQPGGLPLHVGCVVSNVETLINLGLRKPVTRKYLTVAGAVRTPATICAPIGTTLREAIEAAGGPAVERWGLLTGGTMMGKLAEDPETPITKTTGGIIVLPGGHMLLERYRASKSQIRKIAKSACDQCSFCTELCPRYLLGHPIEPHLAMRAEGFAGDTTAMTVGTLFCCECNLCSLISCPEDLDPKNICVYGKALARERGQKWNGGGREVKPHPMFEFRRTPIPRLKAKLGLLPFRDEGPLVETPLAPARVRLLMRQHAGAPAAPIVSVGQQVEEGDLVARAPEGQLGAPIHASIAGVVASVSETEIAIETAKSAKSARMKR